MEKKLSYNKLLLKYKSLEKFTLHLDRLLFHDALQEAMNKLMREIYQGKHNSNEINGAMRFFNYYKEAVWEDIQSEWVVKLEKGFNNNINRLHVIDAHWYCPIDIPDEEKN